MQRYTAAVTCQHSFGEVWILSSKRSYLAILNQDLTKKTLHIDKIHIKIFPCFGYPLQRLLRFC
jgi:hypothetical protein